MPICHNCLEEIKGEKIEGKAVLEYYCSKTCEEKHETIKKEDLKRLFQEKIKQGYEIQFCNCGNHISLKPNQYLKNCQICGARYEGKKRRKEIN